MPWLATRLLCPTAAFALALAAPASAQESSKDREEFDTAAGRIVYRSGAAPSQPAAAAAQPQAGAQPGPGGRRAVRVILPSPYGQ